MTYWYGIANIAHDEMCCREIFNSIEEASEFAIRCIEGPWEIVQLEELD